MGTVGFDVLLKMENTGRRFGTGGGELVWPSSDGGLDLGTSSDHIPEEFFGLDVGGSDDSKISFLHGELVVSPSTIGIEPSILFTGFSTRLRLVGGSSSYSVRFCRE